MDLITLLIVFLISIWVFGKIKKFLMNKFDIKTTRKLEYNNRFGGA